MKRPDYFFICLLAFSSVQALLAQNAVEKVEFSRIETNSGLSNSNVTSILQDSRGFLWVGTEDGLNRFDGYTFKVYRNDQDDEYSLLRNSINFIFEDHRNTLWISTRGEGLHYYDGKLDRFCRVGDFIPAYQVISMTQDDSKELWVTGGIGSTAFVARLDTVTRRWERFSFPSDEPISGIVRESENEFLIGFWRGGVHKWNKQTNTLDSASLPGIVAWDIRKMLKDSKGNIWIAADEGLTKVELKTRKVTNFIANPSDPGGLLVNSIRDIIVDNEYLWLATENGGMSRLDTRNNRFTNFVFDKNDPFSLSDNSVWSVYKDRQNRIWAGTFSKGLCVIDSFQNKFSRFNIVLENDIVNAIYEDHKKRMWIGTEGGIACKDGDRVRYYRHDPNQKGSLSSNPILCIFEDSKQRLWFGTWAGGINRYDEQTDSFVSYQPDENRKGSLSNPNVYSISEHKETGQLLVATYRGLNVMTDEKTGTFETYLEDEHKSNYYLRTIYEDSSGNIWLGTIEELNLFDPDEKRIVRFDSRKNDTEPKTSEIVNCIMEDKAGRLWVGSTAGLQLIVDGKFEKRFTTADGLPNNIVSGILEDNNGNLWLSTTQGICKFNPNNNSIQNYSVSDGLLGNEFKPNACFKGKDGLFYFGGKGVNVFAPEKIMQNPYVPPVYLTDFKIFNKSVQIGAKNSLLKKHISYTKEIYLPHDYNFFSLEFAALNFSSSDKNQYAYRLLGFDKDWIDIGNQRSATFTNLDAGTYTFSVKASNNDGLWNNTGTSLIIYVLPPFWQAWWFRLSGGLLLLGVAISYYKVRVNSIKEQNKKLEVLVEERTRELQNTNEKLILRDKEIQTQNAELIQQREELASQNIELKQARQTIEKKNDEIKLRNETLEAEVNERTKDLVEYNHQLEQFAFISAHNLRAPVARILGLGSLLEATPKNPEEERSILNSLVATTRELDEVVTDLITVLRLRRSNTSPVADINLEEELAFARVNLEKEILETKAKINSDFSQAPFIRTLKPYLDSILINLISNAIKYRHINRSPVIDVRSEMKGRYVCLTVSDNGLGIDLPRYGDRLFTLYSRFHDHVGGKGMGLFLVKTQVVALGGKIEVESEMDRGTTFKVFFRK